MTIYRQNYIFSALHVFFGVLRFALYIIDSYILERESFQGKKKKRKKERKEKKKKEKKKKERKKESPTLKNWFLVLMY